MGAAQVFDSKTYTAPITCNVLVNGGPLQPLTLALRRRPVRLT